MHAWAAAVAGLLSSSCPLSQILLIALWALGLIVSFAVLPWSGVGSKNGVYYAVDQDTGALVWQEAVVAGGEAGGFSPSTGGCVREDLRRHLHRAALHLRPRRHERCRRMAVSADGV